MSENPTLDHDGRHGPKTAAPPADPGPSLRWVEARMDDLSRSVAGLAEALRTQHAGSTADARAALAGLAAASRGLEDAAERLNTEEAANLEKTRAAQEAQAQLLLKFKSSAAFLDQLGKAESTLQVLFDKANKLDGAISQRLKEAEDARQKISRDQFEPIVAAFQNMDKRLKQFCEQVDGVNAGLGELEAARRLPLAYRVLAWVGSLVILAVGLGLLLVVQVVYRQSQAAGLDRDRSQVALIAARLDDADGQVRALRAATERVMGSARDVQELKPRHEELARSAAESLQKIEAGRKEFGQVVETLRAEAAANRKALDGLGERVSAEVSGAVTTAVTRPVESNKVALDALAGQVEGLRALVKRPARPERTAVVLFNSANLRAETCKPALERLFLGSPLRWGYEDYQVALSLASNGELQKGGNLLPFGTGPAAPKAFQVAWTTEAGSGDDFQKFDPRAVLPAAPEGVARRCVLVVSPGAAPPKRDDTRWPKTVKVNAVVVGKVDKDRLKEWDDFCKDHGGGAARDVPAETEPLYAELVRATEPRGKDH